VLPLTRRQALAAALALACGAGCQDGRDASARAPSPPTPTRPPPPDPLAAILDTEQRLLAAYDATAGAHPALAARLAPVRADHAEHASALERALGATPPAILGTPLPGTGGAGAGTPTPTPPRPVPGNRASALAALRAAERAAAAARASAAESAPPDRAVLLASIAACEASHEVLLG